MPTTLATTASLVAPKASHLYRISRSASANRNPLPHQSQLYGTSRGASIPVTAMIASTTSA